MKGRATCDTCDKEVIPCQDYDERCSYRCPRPRTLEASVTAEVLPRARTLEASVTAGASHEFCGRLRPPGSQRTLNLLMLVGMQLFLLLFEHFTQLLRVIFRRAVGLDDGGLVTVWCLKKHRCLSQRSYSTFLSC